MYDLHLSALEYNDNASGSVLFRLLSKPDSNTMTNNNYPSGSCLQHDVSVAADAVADPHCYVRLLRLRRVALVAHRGQWPASARLARSLASGRRSPE
jgi:hypothetical protein